MNLTAKLDWLDIPQYIESENFLSEVEMSLHSFATAQLADQYLGQKICSMHPPCLGGWAFP